MSATDDKFYRPRITQRVDFAPDLWMIRINPGGEFKFAPGQYATLGVEGPQKRSERPYSIVSSPYENEMEFFFELETRRAKHGAFPPTLSPVSIGAKSVAGYLYSAANVSASRFISSASAA